MCKIAPTTALHCKEISIDVFPEKELRCLSTNVHINVSVSDLYLTTIGPPILGRPIVGIYKSHTETRM
jgi:hypothetical protein